MMMMLVLVDEDVWASLAVLLEPGSTWTHPACAWRGGVVVVSSCCVLCVLREHCLLLI